MKPIHSDFSHCLGTDTRNFLNLFLDLINNILSIVGDMSMDGETPSLLKILIKVELHVCIHMGECRYI